MLGRGYVICSSTGHYVHVEGGFGGFEKYLVLCPEGRQERLLFEVDREGHLRHVQSGLNVVYNKSNVTGMFLWLGEGEASNDSRFELRNNQLVHVSSGKRVEPQKMVLRPNTYLVLSRPGVDLAARPPEHVMFEWEPALPSIDRLLSRVPTVGYLEHRQSSLVVQIPRENGYDSGTPLVLGPLPPPTSTKHLFSLLPEADAELKHWASGVAVGPENDPQIRFIHKEAAAKTRYTFDAAAGTLLHSESGKYVRPLTIPATKDTKIVLGNADKGALFNFKQQAQSPSGWIVHASSGFIVHPVGGKGVADVGLVLHNWTYEDRLRWRFVDGCLMHAQSGLLVRPKAVVNAATAYDVDLILAARAPNDGDLLMLNDNRMLVQNRFKLAARPKGGERQNAGDYFEVVLSFNRAQPSPGSEFFFVPRYEEGVVSIAAVHIAWAAVRIAAAGWPRGILLEHVEYLRNALVQTKIKLHIAPASQFPDLWNAAEKEFAPLLAVVDKIVHLAIKGEAPAGEHKDTVDSICSGIDQRQSSLLSFMTRFDIKAATVKLQQPAYRALSPVDFATKLGDALQSSSGSHLRAVDYPEDYASTLGEMQADALLSEFTHIESITRTLREFLLQCKQNMVALDDHVKKFIVLVQVAEGGNKFNQQAQNDIRLKLLKAQNSILQFINEKSLNMYAKHESIIKTFNNSSKVDLLKFMLFQQVSMVSLDIESLVRMLMETFAASIAHVRVYDSCDRTTFLELFDAGKPMARLLNDDVINALQTFANRLPVVTPPDDAREDDEYLRALLVSQIDAFLRNIAHEHGFLFNVITGLFGKLDVTKSALMQAVLA